MLIYTFKDNKKWFLWIEALKLKFVLKHALRQTTNLYYPFIRFYIDSFRKSTCNSEFGIGGDFTGIIC